MSALDQIVNINIAQSTSAVAQASFSIPAVFGFSNRFAATSGITGDTVSGSPNLTNLSSITGVNPGASVTGTGIPANTYVLSVAGTTAVLSANATASNTSTALAFQDAIRSYTSLAGMTADGFLTTDPEYVKSGEFIEQTLTPPIWSVGRVTASVAQVDTITVNTGVSGHTYGGLINGIAWSYVSATTVVATIAAGIQAAIVAVTAINANVLATYVSGAVVTLTSATPGVPFTDTTTDADLTIATGTTPNHTITSDIAQAQVQNNSWYGYCICSNTDGDITQCAAFTEPQTKIFGAASNDAAIGTSSTSDLASTLKGLSYKRTFLFFSPNSYNTGIEAALMGGQLPAVPGSNNWAFQTLAGIAVDTLSSTQQTNCIGVPEAGIAGKNVNIYQTVGGVNITEMGTMIGGQYIDITVGIDWLKSQLQTNVFGALTGAAQAASKIPYTDKGTAVLMSAVQAAIDLGVTNGLIDGASPITITAPLVASVPTNQRANRIAPTISFTCRLQGAFNAVIVNGTVTV